MVAVAIVAQAVWGMARTLTPDAQRATIAVGAALLTLFVAGSTVKSPRSSRCPGRARPLSSGPGETTSELAVRVSRRAGVIALVMFGVLLIGLPVAAAVTGARGWMSPTRSIVPARWCSAAAMWCSRCCRLRRARVGDAEQFLAGYGAAQAVPGPLFAFAAYLGALAAPGAAGVVTAAVALVAVFLPGLLLLVGVLPFWSAFRTRATAQSLMSGANAAVVGILVAALYDPVFVTAVVDPASFGLALVCFVLLVSWRTPPWAVVIVGAAGGILLALI